MNRENLKKLADYLAKGETAMRFDMSTSCEGPRGGGKAPRDWECGTVGCALGHGPAAGIAGRGDEDWFDYQRRAFGLDDEQWQWCFAPNWAGVDNTPEGAAARIYWLLERGVPADADNQRLGLATLCYRARNSGEPKGPQE